MLACLVAAVSIAVGCAPTKAPKAGVPAGYESIRMVGTSLGSMGSTVVMAFATVLNKYYPEIEWSSSTGNSGTNPIYITKGTIKAGIHQISHYLEAYGWDKVPESRLRSIAIWGPLGQYIFFIPEDKPWKDITQVPKGLTLCAGTTGTTVPVACEALLKLAGLSKKDFNWVTMGKGEMADAWRAGKIDLGFGNTVGAEPFVIDMYNSPRRFKAMGLSAEQAAVAKAEQTFERIGFEPPSMGNLSVLAPEYFKYDVVCPQVAAYLNSRDDFPEDITYRMAKVFDEHIAELAHIYSPLKNATPQWHIRWARPPLAIHSGVAKYYREKGYLK